MPLWPWDFFLSNIFYTNPAPGPNRIWWKRQSKMLQGTSWITWPQNVALLLCALQVKLGAEYEMQKFILCWPSRDEEFWREPHLDDCFLLFLTLHLRYISWTKWPGLMSIVLWAWKVAWRKIKCLAHLFELELLHGERHFPFFPHFFIRRYIYFCYSVDAVSLLPQLDLHFCFANKYFHIRDERGIITKIVFLSFFCITS